MKERIENRLDRKRLERCGASKECHQPLLPPSVIHRAFEVEEASVYSCAADQPPSLWTRHKAPGVQAAGKRLLCDGCCMSTRVWMVAMLYGVVVI